MASQIAGLYDLGDTLGRGHFAVVKLARHVFTGEQVAVKVIDKTRLDEVSRAHLFQEVRCMKLVQHPNVVRLYDVVDTQTKLYLILELGDGGDLYDYILKHEAGVNEETAKKYFRQIVRAIAFCHGLHVVHRDLKPENVVFFERLGMVKLTDFGFSNKFCPGQKLDTSCGSLAYSAPEILLGDAYDAPKVDVWSLGVILYMLVCGRAPFQEANDSETLTMIMDCKYNVPSHLSPECVRLIGGMLIRDPERRSTLEAIASDAWLGGAEEEPADHLPLVSRAHLSDDDHALILQKMANGNVASKDQVIEALDKNEYNHITATYYLLAERKLRAQRQERAQMINNRISRSDLSPIAITPSVSSAAPSPVEGLLSPCAVSFARKCSIVREEDDGGSACGSPARSPPTDCLEVLHTVHSSPQLPLPLADSRRKKCHTKLQAPRGFSKKRCDASPGRTPIAEKSSARPVHQKSCELVAAPEKPSKKTSFAHSVFKNESTDSLDFLSDDQPRLTNSMSCGDLSVADTASFSLPDNPPPVRCDSISLTEIPHLTVAEETAAEERRAEFNRYSIGNSLSLNSGLSSLQRHKLNLKSGHHRSQPEKIAEKNGQVSALSRLVGASNKHRLDINQNGWKKNDRKKDSSTDVGKRRGSQQAVVDMKLASKCCMLC